MLVHAQNPAIQTRDVALFIGGSKQTKLSKSIRNKVVAFNDKVISAIRPKITYNIYQINPTKNQVLVGDNGPIFTSRKLAKTMAPCHEIVCFLASAGPELDKAIARLNARGRVSSAYVLDAMGSVLIEQFLDSFQDNMRQLLQAKGQEATLRFSPGYCDWPLTEQRELFGLLDSKVLGVALSCSCLMTPRKSVSGVFGLYPQEAIAERYIPCWECGKKNCASRRAQIRNSGPNSQRSHST